MLRRLREWAKNHPIVSVVLGMMTVAWSIISVRGGVDDIFGWGNWLGQIGNEGWQWISVLVAWAIFGVVFFYLYGPVLVERVFGPPFSVEPLVGQTRSIMFDSEDEIVATLRITNRRNHVAERCFVKLVHVYPTVPGKVLGESWQPSLHEHRYLRWSLDEHSAYGERKEFINIPPLDSKVVELAYVQGTPADHFTFATADPATRPSFSNDLWKVHVRVGADNANPRELELMVERRERHGIPAPLEVYNWKDRGEARLAALAKKSSH